MERFQAKEVGVLRLKKCPFHIVSSSTNRISKAIDVLFPCTIKVHAIAVSSLHSRPSVDAMHLNEVSIRFFRESLA